MKPFILALVLLVSMPAHADNGLSVIVVGSKENVISVLQDSFDAEFSNGSRSSLPDRVGFKDNFNGFWTGPTEVAAAIRPMVKGDEMEASAYTVEFSYRTHHGNGKQHITSLIEQIKTVSKKHGDVTVADDPSIYRSSQDQTSRCISSLGNDPDLAVLKGKMALDSTDNQTFAMLANDAVPTDEEKAGIYLYEVKREACLKPMRLLKAFFPNDPLVPLYWTLLDSYDQLILSLYKGQLTFGSFAKIRKENTTRFEEARLKVVNEMKAQDAAANDRAQRIALEQQRVFIEQQRAYAELYKPVPVSMPTPPRQTNTTCSFYGNQMHCTTN